MTKLFMDDALMQGRRQERQLQKRREALERTLGFLETGTPGFLETGTPETGMVRSPAELEPLFFHDHADMAMSRAEAVVGTELSRG